MVSSSPMTTASAAVVPTIPNWAPIERSASTKRAAGVWPNTARMPSEILNPSMFRKWPF